MSVATQPYRFENHYALLFAYFIGISLIAPCISNRKMLRINSELRLIEMTLKHLNIAQSPDLLSLVDCAMFKLRVYKHIQAILSAYHCPNTFRNLFFVSRLSIQRTQMFITINTAIANSQKAIRVLIR